MAYRLAGLCVFVLAGLVTAQERIAKPPVAAVKPHVTELHGDKLVDNYFWLREKSNPDVISYLEAENAYTEAVLKPFAGLHEKLYREILGRIKQTDLSVPYRSNGYWYYSRTIEGKQYPVLCRKKGSLDADEEVTLDVNELAKGHKFYSITTPAVSPDNRLLAYTFDVTGFREYTLAVKDLVTGKTVLDSIKKANSPQWSANSKYLFYTTDDHAKRSYRVYRLELGADPKTAELLYEEKDELFRVGLGHTLDRKFLIMQISSSESSEMRVLPTDRPLEKFAVVRPREGKHRYSITGHRDGAFYVLTNKDAKNFRLVRVPEDHFERWEEIVPNRDDVLLERATVFKDYLVLGERTQGLDRLTVRDLRSGEEHQISMQEPTYALGGSANDEFEISTYRFNYTSFVTPSSVYDYNLATRARKLLKRQEVLGGYDPEQYQTERIWVTARDKTKVPMSIVYKKGVRRDGSAPCLLYGYGSYGASIPAMFSPARLPLLDRGVVYALAHIRGGREMGERWHDDGKMMHKKNTFFDFIDCGNWLCDQKYTCHARLGVQGGSAGGLLVGASLNIAEPGFCKAAVLEVPFVDVINTMLDESLPLTVGEFLEWGNPKKKPEYDYIKTYCPYTNLSARDYPAMLVRTSLNDSQVMYWEPAKYVARLRTLKTDSNPLLLKCNMAAGHGGASGRYDAIKENALIYAFVLWQLGVTESSEGTR
jgi:oligopeptidase B